MVLGNANTTHTHIFNTQTSHVRFYGDLVIFILKSFSLMTTCWTWWMMNERRSNLSDGDGLKWELTMN